jgi:hypothetical protein
MYRGGVTERDHYSNFGALHESPQGSSALLPRISRAPRRPNDRRVSSRASKLRQHHERRKNLYAPDVTTERMQQEYALAATALWGLFA